MGAAAPVIGVVSAVSGIAQRNAEVSAANRRANLQIEANKRAEAIQLLDIERQRQQQKYVSELEKQQIEAESVLNRLQLQMDEIAERVNIAQQLTDTDFGQAQAQLVAAAQQYEAIRTQFEGEQAVREQAFQRTQEQGQYYDQLRQENNQIQQALKQGDIRRAQVLAGVAAKSDVALGISQATRAYDSNQQAQLEAGLQTEVMANQAESEYMQIDENRAIAYDALLNKINRSQAVSQLAAASLLQDDVGDKSNIVRESLSDYRGSVSRIAQLASQGIDLSKDSAILQSNINLGYGESALDNAKLGIKTQTAAQNAQILSTVPTRNVLGSLVGLASAGLPLFSMMGGRSSGASTFRQSGTSVGLYQDRPYTPSSSLFTPASATAYTSGTSYGPTPSSVFFETYRF